MKRINCLLTAALLSGMVVLLFSCKSEDATKPIITLLGDNPQVVVYKSAPEYVDPGFSAMDEIDGEVTVIVYGTVNMASAGEQTLSYKATDAAGNTAVADRIVIVDAAQYLAGKYNVVDVNDNGTSPVYGDSITISATAYNTILFTRFGYMDNAGATATIAGSTITVPQQTLYCGSPVAYYAFTGSGYFSDTSMSINYTRVNNNIPVSGNGSYVRP
jgi:hypothetical protein